MKTLMPDSAELTKALVKRLGSEKDSNIRYQLVETLAYVCVEMTNGKRKAEVVKWLQA